MVHGLERPSIRWPLAGVAMAVPLALHFVLYTLRGGGFDFFAGFGYWIGLSGFVVGHCHFILARRAWLYAGELTKTTVEDITTLSDRGVSALYATVASSLIPGLLLVGVPCVVVAITGLVFVPASFRMARNCVIRERSLLERCATDGSAG
jgi:hypothetical protein